MENYIGGIKNSERVQSLIITRANFHHSFLNIYRRLALMQNFRHNNAKIIILV